MKRRARAAQCGFTLPEAIIVIAVTGIIAAVVATFIRAPVQGYFDSTRRAQLSDLADTALRRMTRDLRLALPNSVRVTSAGGSLYLEFLLTRGGGRYRAEPDASGSGDVLEFGSAASPYRFDVLGQMPTKPVTPGNSIVVYNLGPGFGASDAYQGSSGNLRTVSGVSGNTVTLSSAVAFPLPSTSSRFHVVEHAVSYVCTANATDPAAGELRRHWGYALAAAQPIAFPSGSDALLASGVAACSIVYNPSAVAMRNGVVSLALTLTRSSAGSSESVTLVQEAHVSNMP
ncbi:MAG: type II secretion system protein [Burkholderiales bacterium]|nr:type II secretion system protein [Burkholderiales bacterium]